MNYVLEQAVSQVEAGAQVLDVNVGAPGVDEPALMPKVVKALQSVTSLPLQLDSSNVQALENGLRVYNGKPIVNSTNGEQEKLDAILPLCKSTVRPSWALPSMSGASCPPPRTGWPLPAASRRRPLPSASRGRTSTSTA